MELKSKLSKKFKITIDSKHNFLTVNNVLNRAFNPKSPSRIGVSGIIYIYSKEGLYISHPLII